jgi:hypothetical protein
MHSPKYPLPSYLTGTVSQKSYDIWLENKTANLYNRDKRRNLPYAVPGARQLYRDKIHEAAATKGRFDPFTGEPLRWDLIHKWDDPENKGHINAGKKFRLLPTVDHVDPYSPILEFQICSWIINACKSDQTPGEFIKMCQDIVAYRAKNQGMPKAPARIYLLPPFLKGICTEDVYRKWLDKRAEQLYVRDRDERRPYALKGSKSLYKKAIHAAVYASGLPDPYTGERMKWELIGTWDWTKKVTDEIKAKYRLLPTVDHVDPYGNVLKFEICSWRINNCKVGLTPEEFVEVCRKVVERMKDKG